MIIATLLLSCVVNKVNKPYKREILKNISFTVNIPENYSSNEYFNKIYKKRTISLFVDKRMREDFRRSMKYPNLTPGQYLFKMILIPNGSNETLIRQIMEKDSSLFVGEEGLRVLLEQKGSQIMRDIVILSLNKQEVVYYKSGILIPGIYKDKTHTNRFFMSYFREKTIYTMDSFYVLSIKKI